MQKENKKQPLPLLIQEVRNVIADFSALLLKETAALKKADFKTADSLQAGKKHLARLYHNKIGELAARKDEFPALERGLREHLIRDRDGFNALLKENTYVLERAQNSVKRLVNAILDAARRSVMEEQQTPYSSNGKVMSCKSSSLSLSTDRRL